MSTVTIAMEQLYRPDHMPSVAAGSATFPKYTKLPVAKIQGSAPEFLSSGYPSTVMSISTPELSLQKPAANIAGQNPSSFQTQDDSLSQVSWARAGLGTGRKNVTSLVQDFSSPKIDDLTQLIDLPPAIQAAASVPVMDGPSPAGIQGAPAVIVESPRVREISKFNDVTPTKTLPETPQRPTAPPLRKLKSSLKLPQLTKSQSMSILSPKSVRFASKLEKVKMFDGKDSPCAVSLQCSPSSSPKYEFALDDYFSIRHDYKDLSDDESYSSSGSETYAEPTNDKQYKITSSNFVSPQNIYDKRQSPVYLQTACFTADKKSLVLLVMCQNLAFEKTLSLKLTFNDWKSQMIYNSAVYSKSFSSVNFDQFKFTIPLAHLPSRISTQFCIQYDVNGSTYWDNNSSKNYRLELERFQKASVSKDMFNFKPSSTTDSFTYRPPTFSPRGHFKSGAGPSALASELSIADSTPKYSSSETHYDELVNKLMSVKKNDERPKVTRSLTSYPKPRYSQSYMSKRGTESTGHLSPLAKKSPLAASSRDDSTLTASLNHQIAASKPASSSESTQPPSGNVRPQLKHSSVSAPDLSSVNFKTMSYADLLQNYCFTGVDRSVKSPTASSHTPFNSSCNTSGVPSDYLTPASTFQPTNDSFFV